MMRDGFNDIEVHIALSPQIQTNADTAFTGNIIDSAGFESVTYHIAYGGITDANVTFVTLLEDGNDSGLSDNAAVDDAFLIGTEAGATPLFSDDNKGFKLGYVGPKRYTRLTITPTGNNAGDINISAVAILRGPRKGPKTTQKV